ncbi:MAG TPA: ABC transporter permease, partial [Chloroflexota bacterium]|nr:ABC transporter permease [Chloroflexota bacterium]
MSTETIQPTTIHPGAGSSSADQDGTPAMEPKRIPGRPTTFQRYEPVTIGTIAVVAFLSVWQWVAWLRIVPEILLPGPSDIINSFVGLFRVGEIWNDMYVSGQEIIFGYSLAVVVGLPLGLATGWYKRFRFGLDPFLSFFYSTPRIALIPLLIIWLGIGIYSKIAVIFLGAIFPIVVNTMAGVANLDSSLLRAARSFGASDAQIFRTIALPGSVPFILAGLRLAVGHALTGVVVGELVAAQAG